MSGKQMWMPSNRTQENSASQEVQQTTTISNESVAVDSNANSNTPRSNSFRGNRGRGRGNNRKPREPVTSHSQESNQTDAQSATPSQPKPKPKRNPRTRKPKNKEQTPNSVNTDSNVNTTTTTTTTTSSEDSNISSNVEIMKSKSGKVPTLIKPKSKPEPTTDTHSALAANIIERLESNSYECMICTDVIRRQVTIWHCTNCFSLFHLYCIKKWCKSAEDQGSRAPWRCPGCQYVYVTRPSPRCYCAKTNDPAYNPYLLPHSCGEICGKSRSGDCPHPCNLICHPGHCPPCSAVGPLKYCYCGNESYRLRCGQKDPGKSCGEICDKMLNCNKHKCKEICHEGRCKPCGVSELQICYCAKVRSERSCGSGDPDVSSGELRNFSCAQICDRKLECGNHRCEKVCHKGPCEECPLLPKNISTCPCGKIPLELISPKPRTSCLDDIKTCPNTCGKLLLCGKHTCPQKCHSGPCAQCTELVKAPCRCHGTFVTVPCHQVNGKEKSLDKVICNKLCKAKRICTRHDCGNQCCPSSIQADPEGYDISGAHICNLICNRKLKCNKHLCDLLCHSGRCPPCHITMHEQYVCECGFTTMDPPIMCGTKLPECPKMCSRQRPCGHANTHPCHSRDTPCPPCTSPTEKLCLGGHEIKKYVPCNVVSVSCGRTCGKMLVCGVHPCKRVCHGDACQPVTDASCGQLCGRRRELCEHKCTAPCHGDKPCPKNPCRDLIRISCPCKRRSVEVECLRGGETDTKDNTGVRELMCDEQCAIEARNRKLAEAFGISLDRNTGSIYPDILLQLGKANREFVMRTEKRFEELVKSGSTRISMPPMDRVQRRMVHEMAKFYNVDTESYDKEPNRTVTVTKRKDSKIPQPLLSAAIVEYVRANQPTGVTVSIGSSAASYYGLLVSDAISHGQLLQSFMAPFAGDYQIKWLDNDALVVFTDQTAMKTALFVLAGGPFQVREYKEKIEIEEPKKQPKAKVVKPFTLTAPTPEWCKDSNFFASLYNMEQQQQQKKEEVKKSSAWADMEEEEAKQTPSTAWTEETKPEQVATTTATTLPSYENWEESAVNEL